MKLPSDVRFADEKIKEAFYKLENGDDQERELFKLIDQAMNNIEQNAFCGIQIAKKQIPKTPEITKPKYPTVITPGGVQVPVSMIFFAYQYKDQPETLIRGKIINIDGGKDTIIDTNSKTSPDDFLWIENAKGELVGAYLFSFNKDSGRYQSVISPLQKSENYDVKIYRYRDGNSFILGEGILKVREKIVPPEVPCFPPFYICFIIDILFLLLLLFLVIFYMRYIRKIEAK